MITPDVQSGIILLESWVLTRSASFITHNLMAHVLSCAHHSFSRSQCFIASSKWCVTKLHGKLWIDAAEHDKEGANLPFMPGHTYRRAHLCHGNVFACRWAVCRQRNNFQSPVTTVLLTTELCIMPWTFHCAQQNLIDKSYPSFSHPNCIFVSKFHCLAHRCREDFWRKLGFSPWQSPRTVPAVPHLWPTINKQSLIWGSYSQYLISYVILPTLCSFVTFPSFYS